MYVFQQSGWKWGRADGAESREDLPVEDLSTSKPDLLGQLESMKNPSDQKNRILLQV